MSRAHLEAGQRVLDSRHCVNMARYENSKLMQVRHLRRYDYVKRTRNTIHQYHLLKTFQRFNYRTALAYLRGDQ